MAVSYVPTPTLERDTFESLFAAYKNAFPAGTSVQAFAKAVCAANGIPYSTAAIEAWIFGLSGKRFAFDAKNNPGMYGGTKNVGWAHFAAGNVIKLPDYPRAGLEPVSVQVPDVQSALLVRDRNVMLWVAGAGVGLWLLVAALGKKQKGRKTTASSSASSSPSVTRWTT